MWKVFPAVVLGVAFAGLPPARADDPRGTKLDKLQGRWRAQTGPRGESTADLEVSGDRAVATVSLPDGRTFTVPMRIKLDESSRPKAIDWIAEPSGGQGGVSLGIYEFDGDTLKVCTGGDRDRPSEFKAGAKGFPALKVYRRRK